MRIIEVSKAKRNHEATVSIQHDNGVVERVRKRIGKNFSIFLKRKVATRYPLSLQLKCNISCISEENFIFDVEEDYSYKHLNEGDLLDDISTELARVCDKENGDSFLGDFDISIFNGNNST